MDETLKWGINNGIGVAFFLVILGGFIAVLRWSLKKDGLFDSFSRWFVVSTETQKRVATASEKQAEAMEQHLTRQVNHYKETGEIHAGVEAHNLCTIQMKKAAILYLKADIIRHSGDENKEVVNCLEQAKRILESEHP